MQKTSWPAVSKQIFLTMNTDVTTMDTILAAIPESLELLVFGIVLIVAVVVLRWFLKRGETEKKGRGI